MEMIQIEADQNTLGMKLLSLEWWQHKSMSAILIKKLILTIWLLSGHCVNSAFTEFEAGENV
jgi:hypothetical protein